MEKRRDVYVIAGDMITAENVTAVVESGEQTALQMLWHVGSYARFAWAVKYLTRPQLLKVLPELWVASDPDDTNLDYLTIWQDAHRRNKGQTVCDGRPLLKGKLLTIYRGQLDDTPGISWSLSKAIAGRFAKSGGLRGPAPRNGHILETKIEREKVLAYLTKRDESEIIVDPFEVRFSGTGKLAAAFRT